ncbi:hypothetical protein CRE_14942 [Caenorhabditis remanei]|uniref:Uncharacterized protein n=1 Tax=Caenorhabditis remanei TaxID=31234 RepID=E3NBY6_CAERE|nr:hypothetical protein CRE_14942 [Caenorhabditis remanei]
MVLIANEMIVVRDAINRRDAKANDQIGRIIHSHGMNNQDRIHQIVVLQAEITGEFFGTLQAIEEFERQKTAMWRLIDLGLKEDDGMELLLWNRMENIE